MAGALVKRKVKDPKHLMRFLMREGGMEEKEIAKKEGVTVQVIRQSLLQIEAYRNQNTGYEMDLAVRDLVIGSIPAAKAAFDGLLNATEIVEMQDSKTGKKKHVTVEDKTTRLEAIRTLNGLISALQPKQPVVQNNVSNTTQTAVIGTSAASETLEDKVRRLRKQALAHNQLPPEVVGVPKEIDAGEAPIIDAEEVFDVDEE